MSLLYQHVGIDVAADKLDVYFQQQYVDLSTKCKGSRKFQNTPSGHRRLLDWISKRLKSDCPIQCVMEATGTYHENVAYYLYEAGLPLTIVLPNRIKSYARSLNTHSKTDKIDAKIIARFAASERPDNWSPSSPQIRQLRFLTREREQLVDERTTVKNQRHAHQRAAHSNANALRRMDERITFLNEQVTQIEREITELYENDAVLNRKVEVLISIDGFGVLTACTLLAETDCFTMFTNRRQVIKYAGLDIIERQSGISVRGKSRVSKRGNAHLRSALYNPAKSASRPKGAQRELFEKCVDNYKIYNRALMPVQRKLLLLAYALVKNDMLYQHNYEAIRKKYKQAAREDCLQ